MGKPIRITQVLEATAGGTRRHLQELVSALSSGEFEIHIVCAIDRDPSFQVDVDAYRREGHRVSILAMTPGLQPVRDIAAIWRLRQLLRQSPCDILHLHSAKAGWLGRLAARGLDCSVVYSPHAFPFLRRVPALFHHAYRLAERISAPQTDILLAVSEAEGRLAVESGLYDLDRVRVLQNALDVGEFDVQMAKLPPPQPKTTLPTFGLIGDLRPQKDPLVFLEAARQLQGRGFESNFLLPLHGPELANATRFVLRHGLESRVEFVPSETSLTALLHRTDVGVLPSQWEGLPYMMLELLAWRRPLIASDIPVFRDLLGSLEPRLIFPAGDADALAEHMALCAQLSARELADAGERGRRHVVEHHDHAKWEEQVRATYRSIAGHRVGA